MAVEHLLVAAPLRVVVVVDAGHVEVPLRRGLVDEDEPLRLRERERPQEQAVDQRKHRDGRADAEREHADHEQGSEALVIERAPRVADVRADHERSPFVRHADASAAAPAVNEFSGHRAGDVARARGIQSAAAANRPRRRASASAIAEDRLHLAARARSRRRRGANRSSSDRRSLGRLRQGTVVRRLPCRGFRRDFAILTSAPRRSVSEASARCPVRVRR